MSHLLDSHHIFEGDPTQIRGQVSELSRVARHMDEVAARLREIQVDGVWVSEAGRTFGARIGTTPKTLEDIGDRLHDAARIMRPYATQLENSQREMKIHDKGAAAAQKIVDARDATLASMSPDDPDRSRVQRERGEAVADLADAERGFEREGQGGYEDEQRMAGRLGDIKVTLEDSPGYDWFEAIEGVGNAASTVGIVAKPIALGGVGVPVGKAGRRLFYDEGSWTGVAQSGVGYGMDVGTFGVGKVAKGMRLKAAGRIPTKRVERVDALPSKPRRIKDNPIATPAADARRIQRGGPPMTTGDWAKDKLKARTGMSDLEDAFDDWQDFAGAGNVAKSTVVIEHSAKVANRVTGVARKTPKTIQSSGVDKRENARQEQAEQRRRATVERARDGRLPDVG